MVQRDSTYVVCVQIPHIFWWFSQHNLLVIWNVRERDQWGGLQVFGQNDRKDGVAITWNGEGCR